jgi:hypothetical protein
MAECLKFLSAAIVVILLSAAALSIAMWYVIVKYVRPHDDWDHEEDEYLHAYEMRKRNE